MQDPGESMAPTELQKHVLSTYLGLRYGMGLIAFLFPLLVYSVGKFHGVRLQSSISAYYWANSESPFSTRIVFVGILFALASCFYLYKGFSVRENVALNLAGVFAVGVACIPTSKVDTPEGGPFSLHGSCAVAAFACLVYVVWRCGRETLRLVSDPEVRTRYERRYATLAVVMAISPAVAFALDFWIGKKGSFIFFAESCGLWAFAAFWWVKSRELHESSALERALEIQ